MLSLTSKPDKKPANKKTKLLKELKTLIEENKQSGDVILSDINILIDDVRNGKMNIETFLKIMFTKFLPMREGALDEISFDKLILSQLIHPDILKYRCKMYYE